MFDVMYRLFHFLWFIYLASAISAQDFAANNQQSAKNIIFFRNRNEGVSKTEQACNKYILRACNGTLNLSQGRIKRPADSMNEFIIPLEAEEENIQVHTLVVGGVPAAPKEFPHMALIGYGKYSEVKWLCGGSLITEKFVLSAAHCAVTSTQATYIRLGELDLGKSDEEADPKDFDITRTFVHPEYKPPAYYNDIALFEFKGLETFSSFIRPICLNIFNDFKVLKVTAVGWGSTGYGEQRSLELMKVDLDLQDSYICDEIYRGKVLPEGFNNETMICVGYALGGKDTCQGDSGGPLQYLNKRAGCPRSYVQVGIVSIGENCALPNTPAIYTRVSYFIPWIESIVYK